MLTGGSSHQGGCDGGDRPPLHWEGEVSHGYLGARGSVSGSVVAGPADWVETSCHCPNHSPALFSSWAGWSWRQIDGLKEVAKANTS